MSTFGARSSRVRAWLLLLLMPVWVVSACRFGYEQLELQVGAGGRDGQGDAANGGDGEAPAGGGAGGARAGANTGAEGGAGTVMADGGEPAAEGGAGGVSAGGTSTAGAAGTNTAGVAGTSTAGAAGTSTAGAGGTSTAGAGGTSTAGGGGTNAGDLVVTTNSDESDAAASVAMPGGTGLSLREAIGIANATAGLQTIAFQAGIVVALKSALPTITQSTTIVGGVVNAAAVGNADCLVLGAGPSTVDGLEMTGCGGRPISVTGGNDVHISNCKVTQGGQPVEVGTGAGTGTIIGPGNLITDFSGHCVALYTAGILVLDNRIADCGTDGVFVSARSVGARLIGNRILRATTGIGMGAGATGTVMWFNTIAQSGSHGLNVGQSSTNDVRDNIFAFNGAYGVSGNDTKFSQQDYNSFFGNTSGACVGCTPGVHSVLLDPKFVNVAGDDYTLQAGSPVINAGTAVGSDRNGAGAGDFNGAAPDLGYWESP